MMMLPQLAQMAMQQPALDEESGDEREVKEEKKEEEKQEERRALPERGQMNGSGVQDKISSSVTFCVKHLGVVCQRDWNGFAKTWTLA